MLSQKDPRWASKFIGRTNYSIKNYGCLITCFAYILGTTPDEIAKHTEYFNSDALLVDPAKCARDFGGQFDARRDVALHNPVVCETTYAGYQHFVIRENNQILDPLSLDGKPLINYQIKSYRNVWKENMIPEDLLPGRLERDVDGKVWWWTLNGNWFHNRIDLCAQRPDYNQIIREKDAQIAELSTLPKEVIKYVDKIEYVDNPANLELVAKLRAEIEGLQLTNEQKTVLGTWEKIKNLFNKLRELFTGKG